MNRIHLASMLSVSILTGCVTDYTEEGTATDEAALFEPPPGYDFNSGAVGLILFADAHATAPAGRIAYAGFSVGASTQYKSSYHLVPGGICQKRWLTAPFDPAKEKSGSPTSAGVVTITATAETNTLTPAANGDYNTVFGFDTKLAFGDVLTVAVSGSPDGAFGAYSTTITLPYPAGQVAPAPDAVVASGGTLVVSWEGAATANRQTIFYGLERVVGDGGQPPNGESPPTERSLYCYVDARPGVLKIPPALLAGMTGHTVNTFFNSFNTKPLVRFRNGHYEKVEVQAGLDSDVRRLQLN